MTAEDYFICRDCGEEPVTLGGIGLCASCELEHRRSEADP